MIPFGGGLYVCHAFESGSWNDAPDNFYSDERPYQTFLDSHAQELEIAIDVIDLTEGKMSIWTKTFRSPLIGIWSVATTLRPGPSGSRRKTVELSSVLAGRQSVFTDDGEAIERGL